MNRNIFADYPDEKTMKHIMAGKVMVKIVMGLLVMAGILLASAGRLDWLMAWVYMGVFTACLVISTGILVKTSPELVEERMKIRTDSKKWDIILAHLMAAELPLAMMIVAGLDKRFGWSPEIPLMLQMNGLIPMIMGHLLLHRAMVANKFFSAVIRIQKDRRHHVITSGPYQYVRHPGYVGALLFYLPTPIILGSLWAIIPGVLYIFITFIRTALEDRTLKNELAGYEEYTRQVRYRLLPGIW